MQAEEDQEEAANYSIALVRSLRFAGVKFLRYAALDICNNTRCKAVPLDLIFRAGSSLNKRVSVAKVCYGGLPSFADSMVPDSGLDGSEAVTLSPAMETLRILPYAPLSALVICNLQDSKTGGGSDVCCRGLLQSVMETCRSKFKIDVNVGAELEFTLYTRIDDTPVDTSRFAATTSLNQQESYLANVYDQLTAQDIEVELIHAESGPGQMEVVLKYQRDPVRLADHVYLAKETIRSVAYKHGIKAVFLPKYKADQAGNGCHLHLSLNDLETASNDSMTIVGDQKAASFIEGILHHLGTLMALTIPTINSFSRVGPGCWTGFESTWAYEDKEAPLRIVAGLGLHGQQHFEYKLCDATANLYLALAGIISAGLEGIESQRELRPSRNNVSEVNRPNLPSTLLESLDLLEHSSLLNKIVPPVMMKGYLALRKAEAHRDGMLSLEEQLQEALNQS